MYKSKTKKHEMYKNRNIKLNIHWIGLTIQMERNRIVTVNCIRTTSKGA